VSFQNKCDTLEHLVGFTIEIYESIFHSYIYLFVRLFIHSFVRSFIRLFLRLFLCLFIHSFIRSDLLQCVCKDCGIAFIYVFELSVSRFASRCYKNAGVLVGMVRLISSSTEFGLK